MPLMVNAKSSYPLEAINDFFSFKKTARYIVKK
jgi:hypothetical protein